MKFQMCSLSRRSVLHAGCVVGSFALSGCAGFLEQSASSSPELGELSAVNFDDRTHTVHVAIYLDGASVYRESKRLEAGASEEITSARFDGLSADLAPYVVYAWKGDQSREDAERLDFADFDADCLGLSIRIGQYGADLPNPHLSIYHTTNSNVCSSEGTSVVE